MKKLLYCIYKEFKILIRDPAALAIMFIMPMALVFIVTIIQDSTFKSVAELSVPLLYVDKDKDSLSVNLERSLYKSNFFKIDKKDLSEAEAKDLVAKGKYLLAIVVPEKTSLQLRQKATVRISKMFTPGQTTKDTGSLNVRLFFDPVAKESFKTTISLSIDRIVSGIEMKSMGDVLTEQMKQSFPNSKPEPFEAKPLVTTVQEYATTGESELVPNAVQHNVPAWTMFAMFFICIPLSGNIIREREDGSAFRLLTMPGSYLNVMLGKITLFMIVSMLQFALMLFVGVYIIPFVGVDKLQVGDDLLTLIVVAISAGLAATAFGLLVGTVANSVDQAALFGAVFVVILAAMGGVWIPTFVMPDTMKTLSGISPLNWGMEAFNGVFVRGLSLGGIFIHVLKLLIFCVFCFCAAWFWQVKKRMV